MKACGSGEELVVEKNDAATAAIKYRIGAQSGMKRGCRVSGQPRSATEEFRGWGKHRFVLETLEQSA